MRMNLICFKHFTSIILLISPLFFIITNHAEQLSNSEDPDFGESSRQASASAFSGIAGLAEAFSAIEIDDEKKLDEAKNRISEEFNSALFKFQELSKEDQLRSTSVDTDVLTSEEKGILNRWKSRREERYSSELPSAGFSTFDDALSNVGGLFALFALETQYLTQEIDVYTQDIKKSPEEFKVISDILSEYLKIGAIFSKLMQRKPQ